MGIPFKKIFVGVLCICLYEVAFTQTTNNPTKAPFTIHGNVNASGSFYSSNENDSFQTRPKYAWNIYGSFLPKVGKFSFPFSFVINDYSKSTGPTFFQAGISPTYKWIKLDLGSRSIHFSPLVFDGRNFTGARIELTPKSFHFAAFYGRLNKAVNEDLDTLQQNIPRYARYAYGAKIGVGNSMNYFDVMYFHAKDDSNSVNFKAKGDSIYNTFRPQENAVLGSSFKLAFLKKIIFTGDFAVSGLTQNLSGDSLNLDSSYQYKKLSDFVSNFMKVNSSSFASFAGQSSLSFYSRYFNASFNYRRIQPNFNTLGTPYIINDVELFSFSNSFSVVQGKLNVNSSISTQHDDLDKNLNNKTQTFSDNIGVNAILTKHLNLSVNYFGYNLKQKDGLTTVTDSSRLQQSISQFNITPTYNFTKDNYLHFITGNLSYSSLNNKNIFFASQTNSNSLSTSIGYTLGLIKQSCNFSVNGSYTKYKQDSSNYNSYGITAGSAVSFLKEKNLNLQGNIGYYINKFLAASTNDNSNNISYSLNASYNAKRHSFNLFINYLYTPPRIVNDIINKTFQYAVAFRSFTGSISYNYRF